MNRSQPVERTRAEPMPRTAWRRLRALAGAGGMALLAACGGGGGDSAAGSGGTAATTYTVGITVTSAVGSGESFVFALQGTAQTATAAQSGVSVKFSPALASGTAYTVNQTSGPRACTLSANRSGTLAANVEVTANCGAVAGTSSLTGTLRGPVDAQVVLQNNGGSNLTASVVRSAGNTDRYDETAFSFFPPQADGTPYQVSVLTAPANQTCSVYKGATGSLPVVATALRVGCEFTYDLVSRSANDSVRGSYYDSSAPVIGGSNEPVGTTTLGYGEGRFVAFVSSAAGLDGANSAARRQVFWRDNLTGEIRLVSAASAGTVEGNGDSVKPAISADGLVVVFESLATNLVGSDTNGVSDVFAWSALDASVTRISVNPSGVQGDGGSFEPAVSGDGRVIAFSSGASNLAPGVSGINTINVFRHDGVTGAKTLISANAAGTGVGGARPALSEDGVRLAFYSFASDIAAGDTNGLWDIFVYDHAGGARTRVSLTSTGGERNQGIESASRVVAPAISGDGRYVAFATTASNMVPGDTNAAQDVFVVDTQTGAVVRASVTSSGAQGNADSPSGQGERLALSHDGSWVAFPTTASNLGGAGATNMLMHNRVTGETRAVTAMTTGSVGSAAMSRSGAYVVFGASNALDPRFSGSGLFSRFTGVDRSWWWVD